MKRSIAGDIYGGLTSAVVALPLALAFGTASGLGAQAGLYGAIVLGFFASLLGGTKVQISGPTGPMTVVTASAVMLFQGDIHSVAMVVLLGGIFQAMLGFFRLGGLIRYIPYPVISGFMTGIGLIIILIQIHPLVGAGQFSSPVAAVKSAGSLFASFSISDALLGFATLLIVFLYPKKLTRILPSPLTALILITGVSIFLQMNVHTIGDIPTGFFTLVTPHFDINKLTFIVSTALTLAVMGSIDSLLTSLVADSLTKTNHNPNKELMAQGLGNALAAFAGGIPGAGATMRTVVNIKAGAVSRFSGVLHALLLFLILLGAAGYAKYIPTAVLAGILVKVGVDIVDYRFLKLIGKAPKHDILIMFTVLFLTVFVDLIVAVGVGIVLACLLLTYRMTQMTHTDIHDIKIRPGRNEGRDIQETTGFTIRVVDIDGPFFFGSTTQIVGKVGQMLGTKVVIFNCSSVPFMDYSAVFALSEKISKLNSHQVVSILCVTQMLKKTLSASGIADILPQEHVFTDMESAIKHAENVILKP